MRHLIAGAMITLSAVATPAAAQNVADNNGRWWNQAPPANVFVLLNPLTTVYARFGLLYSFGQANAPTNIGPIVQGELDASFGFDGGVGFRFMPVARYELRVSGLPRSNFVAPGGGIFAHVQSIQIMNNLTFDAGPLIGNPFGLNPYLFAGIGISFNSIAEGATTGFAGYDHSRASFAWNGGAGLQWQPLNYLIVDLGYRYMDMGRFTENQSTPGFFNFRDRREHQVTFGIILPLDGLARALGH